MEYFILTCLSNILSIWHCFASQVAEQDCRLSEWYFMSSGPFLKIYVEFENAEKNFCVVYKQIWLLPIIVRQSNTLQNMPENYLSLR